MRAGEARRLIINTDDFGFTSGVNRGIIEAHAHGVVLSCTANGPAFAQAAELAKTVPRLMAVCLSLCPLVQVHDSAML